PGGGLLVRSPTIVASDRPGHARPWLGTYHLVAVYSRALTDEEVRANFRAGPRRRTPTVSAPEWRTSFVRSQKRTTGIRTD
ncbi:MAG: hypothetical protein JXR37_31610, partial [Kiritimatiellae bacterium]|nr:hypothetical protein [Kiritimatiellia bacterium]